jgi:hypothetical protein
MEGRAAGFPGNEKAVEYLVREVTSYGLKPAGTDGYTQEFEFDTQGQRRKAKNVLALFEGADPRLKDEFVLVGGHLDHVGRKGQQVGGTAMRSGTEPTTTAAARARSSRSPGRSRKAGRGRSARSCSRSGTRRRRA